MAYNHYFYLSKKILFCYFQIFIQHVGVFQRLDHIIKYAIFLSKSVKVILIILLVLVVDQWLKIWVKTNMSYGQEISILGMNWAKLHFVENNGMAFGFTLGGDYGKLALSLFRILAVFALGYYISALVKAKARLGLLVSFGLILAGALGNILDSAFYGMIFSESYHGQIAVLFPPEGGYANFLHGRVVDMFYFPMFKGHFPEWLPKWGGEEYLFFRPVFNIADMSITVGVMSILVFYRSFFSTLNKEEEATAENEPKEEEVDQKADATDTTTTTETIADSSADKPEEILEENQKDSGDNPVI